MLKSIFVTTAMLVGVCAISAALADDFEGETPAVKTADRLEWAWDGGDRLGVAVPGTVHYQPTGTPRVIVRGPADLLARVRYDHGRLALTHDLFDWNNGGEKLDVTVTGTQLHRIGVAGSGDVELGELHQDRLSLSIAGSGSIDGSGKVDDLSLSIAGSGKGNLEKMASTTLDAHIAGSGRLEAGASSTLQAHISGSGRLDTSDTQHADIAISGSGMVHFTSPMPEDISTHVSGSGSVTDASGSVISQHRARWNRNRDRQTP